MEYYVKCAGVKQRIRFGSVSRKEIEVWTDYTGEGAKKAWDAIVRKLGIDAQGGCIECKSLAEMKKVFDVCDATVSNWKLEEAPAEELPTETAETPEPNPAGDAPELSPREGFDERRRTKRFLKIRALSDERFKQCCDWLPAGVSKAVFALYREGWSTRRIMERLGISEQECKNSLDRAFRTLRLEDPSSCCPSPAPSISSSQGRLATRLKQLSRADRERVCEMMAGAPIEHQVFEYLMQGLSYSEIASRIRRDGEPFHAALQRVYNTSTRINRKLD